MRAAILITLASSLAACTADSGLLRDAGARDARGSDGRSDAGSAMDAAPPDTGCPEGSSTVRGTVTRTYFSNAGRSSEPIDLADRTYSALVEGDGSFAEYQGRVVGSGEFEIACVPDGTYYLKEEIASYAPTFGPTYRVTSERAIELFEYTRGRAYAARATLPTIIELNAGGLDPWQSTDQLLFAGTHGVFGLEIPEEGATDLHAMAFEIRTLLDATAGDRVLFAQRSLRTEQNFGYSTITKVFAPPPFTTIDGQSTSLSGAMVAPEIRSVSLDWRISEFMAALGPYAAARPTTWSLWIHSFPQSTTHRWPLLPDHLNFRVFTLTASSSDDLEAVLPVPVPAPEEKLVMLVVATIFQTEFPTGALFFPSLSSVPLGTASTQAIVLRPEMTRPRNLTINGASASEALTGVGTAPIFRWDAPEVGIVERYSGVIWDLDRGWASAIFQTDEDHWTVPPGLLFPGGRYHLQLTARSPESSELAVASCFAITEPFSP